MKTYFLAVLVGLVMMVLAGCAAKSPQSSGTIGGQKTGKLTSDDIFARVTPPSEKGKNDSGSSPFIGTWKWTGPAGETMMVFNNGGTGIASNGDGHDQKVTWMAEGKKVRILLMPANEKTEATLNDDGKSMNLVIPGGGITVLVKQ